MAFLPIVPGNQVGYEATAAKLPQAKSENTLGDCKRSSDNKRAFYQRMSSNINHVSGCGAKYKF